MLGNRADCKPPVPSALDLGELEGVLALRRTVQRLCVLRGPVEAPVHRG